jgi:iron complex transport system ATP-binding protein
MQVQNLTIAYGDRIAVDSVSLQLSPGEIVAIVGPNGAGKSTLLRALNGGVKPLSGQVLLDGIALGQHTREAVSRRIAVVAQEAELRFPVTVVEFVLGGRYAWASAGGWGWETEHDLQIVNEVLRETELTNLENRLMNELSGGERQRCLLARALAADTPFLLLDEPTANMDLAHQASVLALVRSRCNNRNTAAIVITHDINLAAHFADQVLLMKQGKTLALGKPKEVLTPNLLREVFEVEVLVDAHPVTGAPRITPVHQMYR